MHLRLNSCPEIQEIGKTFLCVFYNIVTIGTCEKKRLPVADRVRFFAVAFSGREYHGLTELDLFRGSSTEAVGVATRVESQAKPKSRVARSPP